MTNRLPKEFGDEVVGSVIEILSPLEPNEAWHGACLAIAELGKLNLKQLKTTIKLNFAYFYLNFTFIAFSKTWAAVTLPFRDNGSTLATSTGV